MRACYSYQLQYVLGLKAIRFHPANNSADDDRLLQLAGGFLAVSGKPSWMKEAAAVVGRPYEDGVGVE